MSLSFLWDPNKARSNLGKHDVSFTEAASVFADPLSLTMPDPDHSESDVRWVMMGTSNRGRLLVVVHTDIGDNIRIISARVATRHETRWYEER